MLGLKEYFANKWIRKHHCKLAGGLKSLNRRANLLVEEYVQLGHLDIKTSALEVGAHTYIRSGGTLEHINKIGRFCSVSNNVYLGQPKYAHPLSWTSTHPFQYTILV